MSDSDKPGQPGPTPDHIPGWVTKDRDGEVREAVRCVDGGEFPLSFLRYGESIGIPRPPQKGITIAAQRGNGISATLAVPPGYWVVRNGSGELALYSDYDFRRGWTRQQWPWTPAVERDAQRPNPHLSDDPAGIATGAAMVSDRTIDERTDEQGKQNRPAVFSIVEEMASGAGWQGTPPAEGTRRATILEAITGYAVREGSLGDQALPLADEIESALLQATIDAEAMERDSEALAVGASLRRARELAELKEAAEERLRRVARIVENGEAGGQTGEAIVESIKINVLQVADVRPRAEDAEREADAQEAIANVGEVLDAIDAPQAPTFAQRVQRLYRELNDRLEVAKVALRLSRAREVDGERVHNLLDGWDIARSGPAGDDADSGAAKFTLHQRVVQLVERLVGKLQGAQAERSDLAAECKMADERATGWQIRAERAEHRASVARARVPAADVPAGTRELQVVLEDISDPEGAPEWRFIEIENEVGAGVSFDSMRETAPPNYRRIKIPYGRDDEWVQKLAMAAIVAGQDVDRPFPAECLDELLRSFGVTPTLPRDWPDRAATKAVLELPDDVKQEILEGHWRSTGTHTEFVAGERAEEAEPAADVDRLYGEREEARAGEGRFKEERDAAYALLRWLLPVAIARPLSEIGEED